MKGKSEQINPLAVNIKSKTKQCIIYLKKSLRLNKIYWVIHIMRQKSFLGISVWRP